MEENIFQNEFMKVTDENEQIKIWNYTGPNKEQFYNLRGYITNHENKLICPSFGHTEELSIKDEEKIEKLEVENYNWFYSSEGTLCRLYNYEGQWYLSTHKKLSAHDSRWSCKYSFGELFEQSLSILFPEQENVFDWFCSQLDTETVYYFLLRCNSQNRIICNVSSIKDNQRCIFIGKYNNGNYILNEKNDENSLLNQFSTSIKVDIDKNNLTNSINEIDPFLYQGVIGFQIEDEGKKIHVIKILNDDYKNWMNVRGNNPNLRFRYLEVRQDKEMVEKLYKLYPKYSEMFDDFEEILYKVARKIYSAYIERYIKNKYITLPKEEYILLKKCHDWFLENKKQNKVFTRKVVEFLNQESALNLYKMIKRYQMEQKNTSNVYGENLSSEFFPPLNKVIKSRKSSVDSQDNANLTKQLSEEDLEKRNDSTFTTHNMVVAEENHHEPIV